MSERVQGYCPMGCGQTLFLGSGGYITCGLVGGGNSRGCPNPTAAADLLATRETEHIVLLRDDDSYAIQHPLRERLNGELWECPLHAYMFALDGPPRKPGRYRVWAHEGRFTWQALKNPILQVGE